MGKYRYSYSYSYTTFILGKQNQTLVLLSKICDIHSISDKCHKCIGSIKYIKCFSWLRDLRDRRHKT